MHLVQVELQLLGIKVHGLCSYGFFFIGGEGMSKKNLVCAGILYAICAWLAVKKVLPAGLHVQLDNCAGDNKNHTVFGFIAHLVALGIFVEALVSL